MNEREDEPRVYRAPRAYSAVPPPPPRRDQPRPEQHRPGPARHNPPGPPPNQQPPRRTPPGPPQNQQPPRRDGNPDGFRYAPPQRPQPVPGSDPRRAPGDRRRDGQGPPPAPPRRRPTPADPPPRRRRRRPLRRILVTLLVIVLAMSVAVVGAMFYYDGKLNRTDALQNYAGRPADTPGTNWLLVGSDSRAGLSDAQKKKLATGDSDGGRTDTMMLVHIPTSGKPLLISIPRDLSVNIPGQGQHKVNAAFAFGGAPLLVRTVESNTGIRIDHYAEIGFGGFDSMVDAIGGIDMCIDQPIRDPAAGINLKKGCQTLNGQQALGFVRTRHTFARQDLQRVVNQRKFLSALMSKATSPSTLLNPFRLFPFIGDTASTLTVDDGDHIWNLAFLAWALKSEPVTTTVPTGGGEYTSDGASLAWGSNTEQFFSLLANGKPVPENLLEN